MLDIRTQREKLVDSGNEFAHRIKQAPEDEQLGWVQFLLEQLPDDLIVAVVEAADEYLATGEW